MFWTIKEIILKLIWTVKKFLNHHQFCYYCYIKNITYYRQIFNFLHRYTRKNYFAIIYEMRSEINILPSPIGPPPSFDESTE